jgi:hypothetical protein
MPLQNAKVRKLHFKLYYIVAWVLCVALLAVQVNGFSAPSLLLLDSNFSVGSGVGAAIVLWLLHLTRRWAECAFLHVWSDATMHLVVLVFGLLHYVGANLSLLMAAAADCSPAGSNNGWLPRATLHSSQVPTLMYVVGVALVLVGQMGQHVAHRQLAALRQPQSAAPSRAVGKYLLPQGGLFVISSSPHYTFELCIYAGLAVLCGGSSCMLLLLAWSATNLALSALATHQWYKNKFDKTPSQWVICPGVF